MSEKSTDELREEMLNSAKELRGIADLLESFATIDESTTEEDVEPMLASLFTKIMGTRFVSDEDKSKFFVEIMAKMLKKES